MTRLRERTSAGARHALRWVPVLALVAFVLGTLATSLVGATVFAATDVLEETAPWRASSTYDEPVVNRCVSDTLDAVQPATIEARERLLGGDVALWNDEVVAGAPLMANPLQGTVSPLVLPTLVLPSVLAPGWTKLLEVAAVALGCLLLAGRLGLSRGAAAVMTLAFASSGFVVMWTNWPQSRTTAFFPLVLWAVERVLQERTWRSVLPFPFVLAGLVLGGFPALAVYVAYAGATWVLVRLVVLTRSVGRREAARAAGLLLAGAVTAVVLLLPQLIEMAGWLVSADVGPRVFRSSGVDLRPTELSTVFFPQALGTCGDFAPTWAVVNPVEGIAFVGVGVLFLVVAALVLPRPSFLPRGVVGVLAGVALVTFGASFLGAPFAELLQTLPGVGSSPVLRTRAVGGLCLAVLAGLGFHQLVQASLRPSRRRAVVLLLTTVALVALAGATLRYAANAAQDPDRFAEVVPTFTPGFVSAAVAVLVALLLLLRRDRARVVVVAGLVPLVLLAEALSFTDAFWSRPDPGTYYRTTPAHAFLEEASTGQRIASTGAVMYHGAETAYDLRSLTGHMFAPDAWNDVVEVIDPLARQTPSFTTLSGTAVFSAPGLDRLAVSHLVTEPSALPPGTDVTTALPAADEDTTLVPGVRYAVAADAGRLSGVYVDVVDPVPVPTVVSAEVRGADGLLSGGEVTVPADVAGRFVVPLPWAAGRARLVSLTADAPVQVRADSGGVVVVGQIEADPDLRLVLDEGVQVYENRDALPRYRWASEPVVEPDPGLRALLVGGVPLDPAAVVTADDEVPFSGRGATLRVQRDGNDERVVEVSADGDGMLVLADALVPGWTATVDGEPVEMVLADNALMGVPVPQGPHEVRITYSGRSPAALTWVSLATGLLLLGGLAAGAVTGRRRRRATRDG